jgi:hypothetical protein
MFKVDETGLPVEVWPPITLTKGDLETIATDIAEHTAMPSLRKVNGVWQQRSSLDVLDYGYRIHEPEEEEDVVAQMNADLDERSLLLQLQEVTENV